MVRGAHGHDKPSMEEILRVRCHQCGKRVVLEVGVDETKCPSCGTKIRRPKKGRK